MSTKIEYLSRWEGLDARGCLPNIFPDPQHPMNQAVVTLYEPPRELKEKYMEGGSEAWKALEEFYGEAKDQGVTFAVHPLFERLLERREKAAKRMVAPAMLLGEALEVYSKRESRRLSELIIHPWNTRVIPHNVDGVLGNFKHLCETGDLKDPLLVVPLSGKLKDVYVRAFEMIQQKIEAKAKSDENFRREIKQNGIGGAMRAVVGFRHVMVENKELVFTEKDPIRQITGTKYVRGLILDGQRRALGLWKNLVAGWENKKYLPEEDVEVKIDVEVKVEVVEDLDMLTSTHLSIVLNMGSIELNEGEMTAFFRSNPLNKVMVEITGEKAGSASTKRVRDIMIDHEAEALTGYVETLERVHGLLEPSQPTEEAQEKVEEYEKRRWEKREESARRADVFRVQRPVPTLSYAPAQPQPSAQLSISPPAQPVREGVQRPGALPGAADVLAGILKYRKQTLSQLALGNEAKLTIDFSHLHPTLQHRIAKKLGSLKLERTVVAVPFDRLSMKLNDIELLTSGYFLFYKTKQGLLECPNPSCRAFIPLGPIRCPSCGQLIEDVSLLPFPYEFSFE
jgi:hypothetical protein